MFRSRRLNNHINKTHEKALIIVHQDYNFFITERFGKVSFLKIHQRKLKLLVTEIFKLKSEFVPDIMKKIFQTGN